MRRPALIAAVLSMCLVVASPAVAARAAVAATLVQTQVASQRHLSVRAETSEALAAVEARASRGGARVVERSADGQALLLEAPEGVDAAAYALQLETTGDTVAEPLAAFHALAEPSDPDYWRQWALPAVGAPKAWDLTWGAPSVTVAVLDTGIASTHPDLAGSIVPGGWDFVDGDAVPQDVSGHGTAVAGTIAAERDNGLYGCGAAPDVGLLPVRVLDGSNNGNSFDVAQGIRYAADRGADVINMSFGGPVDSEEVRLAIEYARASGCVIVAAAGNQSTEGLLYPAREEGVVAVGAVDHSLLRASFSSVGPELDLVAPGVEIYTTQPSGSGWWQGTSFSAPLVSATAALLMSRDQGMTPAEVESVLYATAIDLGPAGPDDQYGRGLLAMGVAVGGGAGAPSDLVPIYRFYNASSGTHFFTPSAAERDMVIARWPTVFAYEGVAYEVSAANPQPLYRFYNQRSASHFYTASAEERDLVIDRLSDVYTYEGETYRVALSGSATDAVYRFYNVRNGSHFFTASAVERDAIIAALWSVYVYEGPAFYLGR